jgi:tetratricopeptide (TPR) repeat protein
VKYIILFIFFFLGLLSNLFSQNIERELGKLYSEKNYDLVLHKADSLLQINPNQSTPNLIKGRVLVDLGKYDEGKPFIEKAIQFDKQNSWGKAWGLAYLGIIEFISDHREKAKEDFENCLLMNATSNVNNASKNFLNLFGLNNFYKDWKVIQTDNFIFHFPPNTVVANLNSFTNSGQRAFNEINNFFNSTIPKKIDFFVWNTNEDAREWGLSQLGFSRPEFYIIHSRYNQTLGHEITHIISYHYSKPVNASRFINEGIAVAFDQTKTNKLKEALKQRDKENYTKDISIVEAWNNPKKYPEWVYYPLAGELIQRLIKQSGKEKFLKLVKDQSYESAKSIYGKDLELVIRGLEKEIN